jgi:hypothetical protein
VGEVRGEREFGAALPGSSGVVSRWCQVGGGGIFQRPASLSGVSTQIKVLERVLDWLNDLREGRLGTLRGHFLIVVTPDRSTPSASKTWALAPTLREQAMSEENVERREKGSNSGNAATPGPLSLSLSLSL